MPTNNENTQRKAIIAALGGTGPTGTEATFAKTLVTSLINSNVKTKPAVVALVALTDSSGGTANNTVAAIPNATAATTDTTAASLTSTNATIAVIKDDVADLAAKVNAIIAALKA